MLAFCLFCCVFAVSWFTGEDADKKTCLMLDYVIGCLHKCLLFDKDGSFAVKCVKKVMLPIVEQVRYHHHLFHCLLPV